jgi:hypothetical protein
MTKTQFASILMIAIALTGCATKTPNCSDSRTVNLVLGIENDSLKDSFELLGNFLKQLAESQGNKLDSNFGHMKLSLDDIRTVDSDDKLGKFTCSASLVAKGGANKSEIPISFTSELADSSGEKKQYVQATELSSEDQGELFSVLMSK